MPARSFAELELILAQADVETYTLEMRCHPAGSDADTRTPPCPTALTPAKSLDGSYPFDAAVYGRCLADQTFSDPRARDYFVSSYAAALGSGQPLRIQVTIQPGAEALHALVWEALCHPATGVLLATSEKVWLSRYIVTQDDRPVALRPRGELKALAAVASPVNADEYHLAPIDMAGTEQAIRSTLDGIPVRVLAEDGQRPTLSNILDDAQAGADILYLVCHGIYRREETWLYLEDDAGRVDVVRGGELAERLRDLDPRPRLAVLLACESAGPEESVALNALGPRLAAAGIPAVLAMHGQISTRTASEFMHVFFAQVQADGQIDRAVSAARNAVCGRDDAWMPVLYLRSRSGRLWGDGFTGECPYVGLRAFEEGDSARFFGRGALVDDLLARLLLMKDRRALFITGPSGSGKSSLARAGLVPALKAGRLPGSRQWRYATMQPGGDPVGALAGAVSRLFDSREDVQTIRENALKNPDILREIIEQRLGDDPSRRAVLLVDQFEEVFSSDVQPEVRKAFIDLLARTVSAERSRAVLIFTMRSEFVADCAAFSDLNDLLNRQFLQVGALQKDEIRQAITGPAGQVDLPVQPALVERIIFDMEGQPGALPLMQFALEKLFQARQKASGPVVLTLRDYEDRNGIKCILQEHADGVLKQLSEDQRRLTEAVFKRLVNVEAERQYTRRTVTLSALESLNAAPGAVERLVHILAGEDARLLATDSGTITLAHEILVEAWPWLKSTIDANREVILLRKQVEETARDWSQHAREPSYLYTGSRLINALEKRSEMDLNPEGEEFLAASQQAAEAAKRRRERLIFVGVIIAVIVALAMSALAFFANKSANQANQALATATSALGEAASQASQKATKAAEAQQAAQTAEAARARADHEREVAQSQEAIAKEQVQISFAHQLAAQSREIITMYPAKIPQAALLAVESLALYPYEYNANQVLRDANSIMPVLIGRMNHEGTIFEVAFSPDGKWMVSGSRDSTARVWEAATGREVSRMAHDGDVCAVTFSPDGKWVVSGSYDNTARVWEAATGREVSRMTHDGDVYAVAFSPDGKWVVSRGGDKTVRVWEAATGREVSRMTHDGDGYAVAFSPDGKWVVSGSYDNTARVWEAATGREVSRMTHEDWVTSAAFSPDGKWVVSRGGDKTVRVWEAATGREVSRMTHYGPVNSTTFSLDGKWVVSGSYGNTARVWEAATGREVSRMTHDGYVDVVAFSPDGKWVVSGSYDNTVRVWETATGREVSRMTHDGYVNSATFSPDGKWVVSGGGDNTVRVWEAATGREVSRMTHDGDGYVNSATFSPDGKWVVSGGDDNTARVWEAATGREVSRITHDGPVHSATFNPDGKWVVSGSNDGTARVWYWRSEDLIRIACSRLTRNLTQAEWKQYMGDRPYHATCDNLPAGE